jgi:hypothetical protein
MKKRDQPSLFKPERERSPQEQKAHSYWYLKRSVTNPTGVWKDHLQPIEPEPELDETLFWGKP